MINYFGLGEDGRVGVQFERNRTKDRCCNNMIYGIAGIFNLIFPCTRGKTITE